MHTSCGNQADQLQRIVSEMGGEVAQSAGGAASKIAKLAACTMIFVGCPPLIIALTSALHLQTLQMSPRLCILLVQMGTQTMVYNT